MRSEELEKLRQEALTIEPFPTPKKGKEEELSPEEKARREFFEKVRLVLPQIVDELLSKRHKLNE